MFKRNSLSSPTKSRRSASIERAPEANASSSPAKALKSFFHAAPVTAAPLHFQQHKRQASVNSDDTASNDSAAASMQSSPVRADGAKLRSSASGVGSEAASPASTLVPAPALPVERSSSDVSGPPALVLDVQGEGLGWTPPVVLGASSVPESNDPLASSSSSLDTYTTAIDAIPGPTATPRPLAIQRPSMADVPSIFSPRLPLGPQPSSASSPFFTPSASQAFDSALSLSLDPLSTPQTPALNADSSAQAGPSSWADGQPPAAAPSRPPVQSRKSSVMALPRRTPQPMPLANLPTLPPITPSSSQPEDPMRTIRSMPRVLMTPKTPGAPGAGRSRAANGYFPAQPEDTAEEDEEGGGAGEESESDSDEDQPAAGEHSSDEDAAVDGPARAGAPTSQSRRASVSSIGVDSINEESGDDERAPQSGNLRLDDVTLSDPSSRQTMSSTPSPPLPLSDRRNVPQPPRLPLFSTPTSQSTSTQDRFAGVDWSLPTPSAEPKQAPVGAWATFSCPTPGWSPAPERKTKAKTPSGLDKGRTPKAGGQGDDVTSYFEVQPDGTKTPTARTPSGLVMSSAKGKAKELPAVAVAAVESAPEASPGRKSDGTTPGPPARPLSPPSPGQASDGATENEHALDDSASQASERPDSDSDTDADSGDSHGAAPGPADESFVMIAPPTPGARVPVASQEAFRPNLYHQASRSLVNLSSPSDWRVDTAPGPSSLGSKLRDTLGKLDVGRPAVSPPIVAPQPQRATPRPTALPPLVTPKANSAVALTSPPPPASPPPPISPVVETSSKRVRRRNSMSDLHAAPPDYTPPGPGSTIPRPRDEEGQEKLPRYSCNVHIEGYLPRKTEFTSPGVQARDRAWKRQYFVLHGTCLRVYKHDIRRYPIRGADGKDFTGDTLKHVAQGAPHVHFPGVPAPEVRPPVVLASGAAARRASDTSRRDSDASRRGSDASGRRPSTGVPARTPSEPPTGSSARRGSVVDTSVRSASGSASSLASSNPLSRIASSEVVSSPATTTASSFVSAPSSSSTVPETVKTRFEDSDGVVRVPRSSSVGSSGPGPKEAIASHLPFHGSNQLVKSYTLQNAESGLAADYVKKKNVVRVRLQGEQFLLETASPKEVVDWIEAFQAATNVALDLDDRPMPKIITLPRRRRRRRPADAPAAVAAGAVVDGDDSPEANVRAAAAVDPSVMGGAAPSSAVNRMERMLGEDQGQGQTADL